MSDKSASMTDARLAQLKGGLLNPSCKTLAADSALELVTEVERLRADNTILRGDLIQARAALKRHEVKPETPEQS
jgi:hypothetical protein